MGPLKWDICWIFFLVFISDLSLVFFSVNVTIGVLLYIAIQNLHRVFNFECWLYFFHIICAFSETTLIFLEKICN